jgi:Uma2 family endonuclease
MSIRTEATIDDLYRVPEKAEIVDGEIVMMSPTGSSSNQAAGRIYISLVAYLDLTGLGEALTDNGCFVVDLPNRKSFSPDAAFYIGPVTNRFVQGPPLFAVEVRSEGDYGLAAERKMAAKRADYFAAGSQVVWDVDLESDDVVRVYRAGSAEPTIYRRGQLAEAEPALPGWKMPVDDLFPRKR